MTQESIIAFFKGNLLEVISICIALLSAFYTFISNRIAKKNLALAVNEYLNKQSKFKLYYIEGYRFTVKESNEKLLLFNISVSNGSETKNTFKATLEIEYKREDNSKTRVLLEHQSDLQRKLGKNKFTIFSNEIRIEEKATETKWLLFEQPKKAFENYRIEKYTIKIIDIHETEKFLETSFVKNILNEVSSA